MRSIADNLSRAGWSLDYVSAIDSNRRTILTWMVPGRQRSNDFTLLHDRKAGFAPALRKAQPKLLPLKLVHLTYARRLHRRRHPIDYGEA